MGDGSHYSVRSRDLPSREIDFRKTTDTPFKYVCRASSHVAEIRTSTNGVSSLPSLITFAMRLLPTQALSNSIGFSPRSGNRVSDDPKRRSCEDFHLHRDGCARDYFHEPGGERHRPRSRSRCQQYCQNRSGNFVTCGYLLDRVRSTTVHR